MAAAVLQREGRGRFLHVGSVRAGFLLRVCSPQNSKLFSCKNIDIFEPDNEIEYLRNVLKSTVKLMEKFMFVRLLFKEPKQTVFQKNMSTELIEHGGIKFAEIIWVDTQVKQTTLFSPPESSFHLGCCRIKRFVELPHYHAANRQINDLQQMFVVQKGVVAVNHSDDDFLREIILRAGMPSS